MAKAKAQEIDSQLLWGRFDWGPYLKGKQKPAKTVAEWIERYEADHWASTPRTLTKENSYQQNYRLFFNWSAGCFGVETSAPNISARPQR